MDRHGENLDTDVTLFHVEEQHGIEIMEDASWKGSKMHIDGQGILEPGKLEAELNTKHQKEASEGELKARTDRGGIMGATKGPWKGLRPNNGHRVSQST